MIEKKLRKYILSNVVAMTGISLYILADTFFIAQAGGTNGITALNLVLPIYSVIYGLGAMIGIGSATRYALHKSFGATDTDEYFSSSLIWTLAVSLIFVIAGIFCPEQILRFMGADTTIMEVGFPYIRIVLCFAPFFMVNYTFTAFVRNDGAPAVAMTATLISGIFNIVFDYILVFPLGLSMVGAALATGISPLVSMGICMFHYLSKKNTVKLLLKKPSIKRAVYSCKLGVVAFVEEISSGITTMTFNFLLLSLGGNVAVAAYGVIANIAIIAIALFNGISQGLQPLASEAHGSGDEVSEKRIYKQSLKIGGVISACLIVAVMIFADKIIAIFNTENSLELSMLARVGMRVYFAGFIFAIINIVTAGFCSATGRARESAFISLSRGIVAIVLFAILLSKAFGVLGVWLAFPAAELFTLAASRVLIKKSRKVLTK